MSTCQNLGMEFEIFCRKNNVLKALNIHEYDNGIFGIIAPSRLATLPTNWKSIIEEGHFDLALGFDEAGLVMAAQTSLPLVAVFSRLPQSWRAVRSFIKAGPAADEIKSALNKACAFLTRCTEVTEILVSHGVTRDKIMVLPMPPEFNEYIHQDVRWGIGTFASDPTSLNYAVICASLINDLGFNTPLRIFCEKDHFDFSNCLKDSRTSVEIITIENYKDFFQKVPQCQLFLSPDVTRIDGERDFSGIYSILSSLAQVPQVASCHGIFPDIIEEGVTGFLVPERNAEIMQDRCLEILEDTNKGSEMGQSARAKIEFQFEYKNLAAKLEGFLNHTLRRRN
ncbi:hypothetical protein KKF34_08185 [Myxococcota bacterium]|nr:hypothetical protein [Myxococcota bacterium]MBU1496840.1 hypothetical protein [Myxococcota bacterium]